MFELLLLRWRSVRVCVWVCRPPRGMPVHLLAFLQNFGLKNATKLGHMVFLGHFLSFKVQQKCRKLANFWLFLDIVLIIVYLFDRCLAFF